MEEQIALYEISVRIEHSAKDYLSPVFMNMLEKVVGEALCEGTTSRYIAVRSESGYSDVTVQRIEPLEDGTLDIMIEVINNNFERKASYSIKEYRWSELNPYQKANVVLLEGGVDGDEVFKDVVLRLTYADLVNVLYETLPHLYKVSPSDVRMLASRVSIWTDSAYQALYAALASYIEKPAH